MLFRPSGKGRKRQKKGEKGRFRPISGKGGQTPLKPPFVTPPFAAAQTKDFQYVLCIFAKIASGAVFLFSRGANFSQPKDCLQRGKAGAYKVQMCHKVSGRLDGTSPNVFPPQKSPFKARDLELPIFEGSLPNCWPHCAGSAVPK